MVFNKIDIFTDGACSGNPGMAGIGVVICHDNKVVWEFSRSIGRATNNIAEYAAVLYGLQQALIFHAEDVTVHTDSELFAKQMRGEYRVKDPNIKFLFSLVQHLRAGFSGFQIEQIPRAENQAADRLAKQAIKTEQTKAVALELFSGEESPSSKG